MEDGGDSVARHSNRTYLKCRNECSIHPVTSDFDKDKSKDISGSQESKKEFKSRKHVLESLHKPGIVFGSHY